MRPLSRVFALLRARADRAPTALGSLGALLAAGLLLSGCSDSESQSTSGASGRGEALIAPDAPDAAKAPGAAAKDGGARREGGNAGAAPADGGTSGNIGAQQVQRRAVPDQRAIVYTATLSVRVKDVQEATQRAEDLAAAAGGLVTGEESSNASARSGDARTTLTVRVPPGAFRTMLRDLAALGDKLSGTQSANDVTTQVVDVESRIESQRRSVDRVRALLGQAKTVGEIVSIESELAKREAELEALEARQKALAEQTDLATVTVTFAGPDAPAPRDSGDLGFLVGLRNGWHALTTVASVTLTILGALLPFLVVLAVLGLPGAWGLRRLARRSRDASPAPGVAAPSPGPR